MSQTVLLTLGRLPKALAVARALKSQGCRVIVAEPFGWHVVRPSRSVDRCYRLPPPNAQPQAYRTALLQVVRDERIDLIIPISEEIHHVLPLRSQLPPEVQIVGPDSAQLAALQNKLSFAQCLAAAGTSGPETHPTDSASGRALMAARDFTLKPALGCSGIGVSQHCRGDVVDGIGRDMLVQATIEGAQFSSLTWLEAGEETATVVYRGTVFSGSVAVCFERCDGMVTIHNWISSFIGQLDFTGFVAFDFIVDDDGIPWAIECNPRLTSGVHFFENNSLGARLINSSEKSDLIFDRRRKYQWGYSTLTEAYAALFKGKGREFLWRMKQLASSRDVVWQMRDPLPFLLMTPMSWSILAPTLTQGISLGEASQRDIAALWSSDEQLNDPGAEREY